MKTIALTLAATLIASSSALAGGLFDVNDAPANYNVEKVQILDTENTASIQGSSERMTVENDALFDVNDRY